MLENYKINYYCNKFEISIDKLLKYYKNDKKSLLLIFKKIYHLHTGNKIYKPKIENILLFNPLPKYFKINDFKNDFMNICNRYSFHSNPGHNILMGNVILPHPSISPIPFFFQYKYKNRNKYTTSNVFYYEIIVDPEAFRKPWDDQSIAIGYGSIDTPARFNHVGWSDTTIGYHSDDGKVFSDNNCISDLPTYSYGDTVGAGIIYIREYEYKLFFTLNGKLLPFNKMLYTKKKLTTMISLDYSAAVTVNFGHTNFLFNIEEYNNPFIISTNNIFIHNYFRLNGHNFDTNTGYFNLPKKKLIIKKKKKVFNNFNTIQEMMFKDDLLKPLLSNEDNELVHFLNEEKQKENNKIFESELEDIQEMSENIIDNIKNDIEYLSNIMQF